MDWEQLREKTLGEVGTSLATEGVGVAGGFIGAGFVGRQVQNMVVSDDTILANPTITNMALAWVGNNAPKLAIWYLLRRYTEVEPGEVVAPMKEVTIDIKKSMAGSVVFDTLMRLMNGGRNPASAKIGGWEAMGSGKQDAPKAAQADIQRLIQENSALRAELNKALQRLASQPVAPPVMVQQPPVMVQQPVVHQAAPTQQVVYQAAPTPQVVAQSAAPPAVRYQPMVQQAAPAPQVVVQPVAPPTVRYQPVTPYTAPAPAVRQQMVRAEAVQPTAPITQVVQQAPPARVVAEQIPPYSRIPYSPGQPFAPYAAQPYPPGNVQEREKRYGFMTNVTPPAVQEREKKFGFMGKEEKDIATMFGML